MHHTPCKVDSIVALNPVVSLVTLIPQQPFTHQAGQYLKVVMDEGDQRPFSIATAPREDGKIQLHIGAEPGNSYAGEVLEKMRTEGEITVNGGLGNAYVQLENSMPTILLAGGTGFSYTQAILQKMLESSAQVKGHKDPVFLYWGTRSTADMYAYDELVALDKKHEHFTFVPVVEHPGHQWSGKTGWVHKAVLEDFVSLEPYRVYIAGRFEMAGVAREDFHQQGLILKNLYGDAFEFI